MSAAGSLLKRQSSEASCVSGRKLRYYRKKTPYCGQFDESDCGCASGATKKLSVGTHRYLQGCGEGIPHGTGRVVTMASAAAQIGGYRSCAAYIASKSAVIGFTKALARELAPFGHTANCVSPGLIDTPMLRATVHPSQSDAAAGTVPLARFGTSEEVAATVAFLVSAEAAYITGATLDVNGGYYMA